MLTRRAGGIQSDAAIVYDARRIRAQKRTSRAASDEFVERVRRIAGAMNFDSEFRFRDSWGDPKWNGILKKISTS